MCNHTNSIDLQKYKNVYFIGIGGSSMSSLAMILKRRGCVVRGYDRAHTRETEMLQNSGIPVYDTTDASHFDGAELIVYTVAFAPDHPEMVLAAQRGVPVIPRARLLEAIAADYPNSIGIAGTHGKSTTSGMTAQIFLSEEQADPTVLIGAALPAIGAAYRIGSDGNFIFEACEYKDSFLSFYPRIAVVLNVRLDHTDYFASLEQLKRSFRQFMNNAGDSGIALVNADAPDAVEAARDVLPQVRYFSVRDPAADYFAGSITYDGGFASFDIYAFGTLLCRASLSVIGSFNVSNALAAAASAHLSGVSAKAIARGLSEFRGVARRFEYLGELNGARVFTDYAHHPDELKATLAAAKAAAGGRLVTLFQPHTFSRLHDLFDDFAASFGDSSLPLFTDVFSAREVNTSGVHAGLLADAAGGVYLPTLEESARYLEANVRPGDTVLLIGAGNVNTVWDIIKNDRNAKM
ncbi:MAG: UDP-N-acetylmuramate--L-alanine ligase [Candidatus Woodwardiibium sp.]